MILCLWKPILPNIFKKFYLLSETHSMFHRMSGVKQKTWWSVVNQNNTNEKALAVFFRMKSEWCRHRHIAGRYVHLNNKMKTKQRGSQSECLKTQSWGHSNDILDSIFIPSEKIQFPGTSCLLTLLTVKFRDIGNESEMSSQNQDTYFDVLVLGTRFRLQNPTLGA